MPPTSFNTLERQLAVAVAAELAKLRDASRRLLDIEWGHLPAEAPLLRRVAIVAADAGNVRLRLAPLRIAFVRVASSSSEAPLAELIFPSELPSAELVALMRHELPSLLAPLDEAGVATDRLLEASSARRDRLAAVREVLEWGAILGTMRVRRPEPVLVVRDGLLRSIAFDADSFASLRDALLDASAATGNRLVAVAKQVPGGADLVNRLLLGGVLDRRPEGPLAWLRIPLEMEQDMLPASFVQGRRMGPLLLVRMSQRQGFVPIETADGEIESIHAALGTLFGPSAEYWPEPGMPVEVRIAHERARISALDRDWLHRAFLDQLEQRDPRLARRAVLAEVLRAGGTVVTEEPS